MGLKITIVTPSYNQANFLERTILSVINQNYRNFEYIIIDGGSTDGSIDIIKKYEEHLTYWVSEKDNGMYDAINKGYARSSGEIMGWLNSDDILFPNALASIAQVFESFKDVDWITGIPITIDEEDRITGAHRTIAWSRRRLLSGSFQWIQQESTYWRRSVWANAGSKVSTDYSLAGDFELWARFSRQNKLFVVKLGLAGFRMRRSNQKSLEGTNQYHEQVKVIIRTENRNESLSEKSKILTIRVLRKLLKYFNIIGFGFFISALLNHLLKVPKTIAVDRSTGGFIQIKRPIY